VKKSMFLRIEKKLKNVLQKKKTFDMIVSSIQNNNNKRGK
jgi:hypothetical protein